MINDSSLAMRCQVPGTQFQRFEKDKLQGYHARGRFYPTRVTPDGEQLQPRPMSKLICSSVEERGGTEAR